MSDVKKRLPINGTFELTGRCNLSCKMCLVRVDQKRIAELGYRERSADEWIHMAEQAAGAGTLSLLLTGGEVMIRPDFCEIYEAIAKMGFILTVYTNATMVTDRVMELFRKYPPHKIGVTMYGASNETYARLCRCKDGYDRFKEGLKRLAALPSHLDMRTTIVKENIGDLSEMRAFVKENFGEQQTLHISRTIVNRIRDGVACPKESRLSPEDNIELIYPGLREFRDKFREDPSAFKPPDRARLILRHRTPGDGYLFQNCGAGIREYTINWAGRMYACELLDQGYTEPFEDGFETAWQHLTEQYPQGKKIRQCVECRYSAFCEACPAVRLAETGSWFGVPEYICEETKYIYQLLEDMNAFK